MRWRSTRTLLSLLALILAVLGRPAVASAQRGNQSFRVGEIRILGNTHTPERIIRSEIDFYPGQLATAANLRNAEKRLTRLGLFVVDPAREVRPTVVARELVHPESETFDIEIRVQEAPTNFIRYAVCDLLRFALTGDFEYLESAREHLQRGP
jgi:hypothetical protein